MYADFRIRIGELLEHKLQKVTIIDRVSECFKIVAEFSEKHDAVDMNLSPGEKSTIEIKLGDKKREYHGIIEKICKKGVDRYKTDDDGRLASYEIIIRPRFFLLNYSNEYNIFQKKTTSEILHKILKDGHQIDFDNKAISTTDSQVHNVYVQYNESDFNFVSRLLEEEGLFYYFDHSHDKDVMVISDHVPHDEPIKCEFYNIDHNLSSALDKVTSIGTEHRLISKSTKIVQFKDEMPMENEGFFESIALKRYGKRTFDYTGMQSRCEKYAERLCQIEDTGHRLFYGTTTSFDIYAGGKLKLHKHSLEEFNEEYFITFCQQVFSNKEHDKTYEANFEATHKSVHFRPSLVTPRPVVHGYESAVVLGKPGDVPGALHTNDKGEIKIRFHWQNKTETMEELTCWTPVVQHSSGHQVGTFIMPRVDQEVIVIFVHGNPNAPLVIGSVRNAENRQRYISEGNHDVEYWITQIDPSNPASVNYIEFVNRVEDPKINVFAQRDLFIHAQEGKITIRAEREIEVFSNSLIKFEAPSIKLRAEKIDIGGKTGEEEKADLLSIRSKTITEDSDETHVNYKQFFAHFDKAEIHSDDMRVEIKKLFARFDDGEIHSDDSRVEVKKIRVHFDDSEINAAQLRLRSDDAHIEINNGSIRAELESMRVHANAEIHLEASGIHINGNGSVDVRADGKVSIRGAIIDLN